MITTTSQRGGTGCRRRGTGLKLCLLILCLGLSACTNSQLIIGPLYNRLDNQIRSEFNKLGDDFSDEQKHAFEQAVGTFHVWHRQSELPQYARFLQEMASAITQSPLAADQTQHWVSRTEAYVRSAGKCYPANFMTATIRTLSDKQLNYIERRFRNERRKNRERHHADSPEERLEQRLERLEKWAGRMNLTLNTSQRNQLRANLSKQISLRKEYGILVENWSLRLFKLARNQQAPRYESRLQEHMNAYWTLLEKAYPKQWQANRQLWQDTVEQFVNSLTREQRRNVSQWLKKMGKTLHGVSQDKPSFNVGTDPSVGCLVN